MPVRLVREGILTSKRVAQLDWGAEVFFRRLLSVVDDFGRYHADLGLLRAACYPRQLDKVTNAEIGSWLLAAINADLILVYGADDGESYVQVNRFNQQIRSKQSKFPSPPGCAKHTHATAKQLLTDAHLDVDVDGDGDGDDKRAPTVLVTDVPSADPPEPVSKVKAGVPDCPAPAIIALYHEILPELPKVERLTETRRGHIRQRWREWATEKGWESQEDGLADWRKFFAYIRGSPFLMGKAKPQPGRPPFVADIDFLMAASSHVKIFEGKYHATA